MSCSKGAEGYFLKNFQWSRKQKKCRIRVTREINKNKIGKTFSPSLLVWNLPTCHFIVLWFNSPIWGLWGDHVTSPNRPRCKGNYIILDGETWGGCLGRFEKIYCQVVNKRKQKFILGRDKTNTATKMALTWNKTHWLMKLLNRKADLLLDSLATKDKQEKKGNMRRIWQLSPTSSLWSQ